MNLTPSQQQAIDHRGSNLLVSASAGSGKTEVLARRVVALIGDAREPCGVDRLLVVTFTRAAAAELRVRIARMLRKQADQTRDSRLRDHLRRQEVLVDTADIGTIDAWCGRIVRRHAAEAGVDGAFGVLSDEDARLLRRHALDELFTWIYSADEPLAVAGRDWLRRHSKPGDSFLRAHVTKLSVFRENVVDVERWLDAQRDLYASDEAQLRSDTRQVLVAALAEECAFQNQQLAALFADGERRDAQTLLQPLSDALGEWHARLARSAGVGPEDALLAVLDDIDGFKLKKPRGLAADVDALFEEVRKRWLKERLQKRWSRGEGERMLDTAPAAAGLLHTLLGLEQRYQDLLAGAKRAQAAYEFHDVLRMALDLLGTPKEAGPRAVTPIARRNQRQYEHVLVDEYQDTSPVQVEVLRLVTRPEPGCTNRFMVGDVKQSIYGFRQAEPRLFADLVRAFDAGQQEGRGALPVRQLPQPPRAVGRPERALRAAVRPAAGRDSVW